MVRDGWWSLTDVRFMHLGVSSYSKSVIFYDL